MRRWSGLRERRGPGKRGGVGDMTTAARINAGAMVRGGVNISQNALPFLPSSEIDTCFLFIWLISLFVC